MAFLFLFVITIHELTSRRKTTENSFIPKVDYRAACYASRASEVVIRTAFNSNYNIREKK